ncbi:MAG: tetratricopeptide repeat protein [Patescibacteria group bacterium]
MKKILSYVKYVYFYLKGVTQFRSKNYNSAKALFEKAIQHYEQYQANELFYQYYGQTLLALGNIEESFYYLSQSYSIYERSGWKVSNNEEYRLTKDTLNALNYIDYNYNLKIDNVEYDKQIKIEKA